MEDRPGCARCIGYLIPEGLTEPSECMDCHQMTWNWVQYPDGTYGGKCAACGMLVVADLNTECELDGEQYMISIPQQQLDKGTLLGLSRLVHMNVLQTRKVLEKDGVNLSGGLSYAWNVIPKLETLGVEFSVTPDDMKERYFYAGRCGYPYARV